MFPVDLSLLKGATHMPALPVLERSMSRPDLRLHDFCIPVNPYFPGPELLADLRARLPDVLRYYPSDNRSIASLLSRLIGIDPCNIVMANGSTELITWLNARFIGNDLVTDVPTFGRWTDNPRELGHKVHTYVRDSSRDFRIEIDELMRFTRSRNAQALAICNPNNPTGAAFTRDELQKLLDATSYLELIVIDESFVDFVDEDEIPTVASDVVRRDNAIVIKSLGKNLGLHGLRCGYAVTNERLARELRGVLPPWNVNALAEELIRLTVEAAADYEQSRRQVVRDTRAFESQLAQLDGATPLPAHANFVYCELDADIPGRELRDVLLRQHGCVIRECGSKIGSTSQHLRIATRPFGQQRLLIDAMRSVITTIRRNGVGLTHTVTVPSTYKCLSEV